MASTSSNKKNIGPLVRNVASIARGVEGIIDNNLKKIRPEINKIIKNKIKNAVLIEIYLDLLVDYAFHSMGTEEFKKLNDYYETIFPENAAVYEGFFKKALKGWI